MSLPALSDVLKSRLSDVWDHLEYPNEPTNQTDEALRLREECRIFRNFIPAAWPTLMPHEQYVPGYHIDAIGEHLQALKDYQIRRLLINIPPGHMKSMLAQVLWPAWMWTLDASESFICASYKLRIVLDFSEKTMSLVESEWYQSLWPVALDKRQTAKEYWKNTAKGFRICVTVGGGGTGERAKNQIIDDPHNIKEIEYPTIREETNRWGREVFYNRVKKEALARRLCIMQRSNQCDMAGEMIEQGWDVLSIPAEYEGQKYWGPLKIKDPRTEEGQALWPEMLNEKQLAEIKDTIGEYAYAGQYQQRPSPREGGLYKPEWFEILDILPHLTTWVRFWDKAATKKKTSAWTVGLLLGRQLIGNRNIFYISDIIRFKGDAGEVQSRIKQTAELDGKTVRIRMGWEAGSAGKDMVFAYTNLLVGYPFEAVPETGSKTTRAEPVAAQAKAGNIKIKKAPWNKALLDELGIFPMSPFKDQADALSGAFTEIVKIHMGGMPKDTSFLKDAKPPIRQM